MSEKTRQPTAQRLREARRKGQVAKSTEIISGAQLVVLLGYFSIEGGAILEAMGAAIEAAIHDIGSGEGALSRQLGVWVGLAVRFGLPLALLLIATTIIAVQCQIGPLFAPEQIKPSIEKLSPLENAKQIVSLHSLFELVKSVLKVLLLSLLFCYLILHYSASIRFLPLCPAACGLEAGVRLLYWMWGSLAGFYVLLSIADFSFQRYRLTRQLMMSVEDIREEQEETEGDPEIRQRRREVQHEIQSGSLAANVARSTVVIRNPTHLAVCLYFRRGETPLPQVLEIGRGEIAQQIVMLAGRGRVPVVENIGVARELAAKVGIGSYIPAELFEPVAHILRLVMQLEYEAEAEKPE